MEGIKLLVLRLTERCNLRCAYCYAACGDGAAFDMDEDTALETVALCCPRGRSLRIQFTGGEPLLRLELMEAVAAFGARTGRRLTLSVQTNGTLLTADACRRLRAIRCGVGVSLDGPGESSALRVFPNGEASFDAAAEGVRNLGQVGMGCAMTTVVTKVNARRLGELADLALYLGNVSGVGLDLFRPLGRGAGLNLAPDSEDLAFGLRALKEKTERLAEAGIPFHFREMERLKKRRSFTGCSGTYCYAQTNLSLAVDGRGDCWPCSSLAGREEYLLGNIREGLPCRGRANLAPPEKCRQCGGYTLCLGGCPAGRQARGDADRLTCMMYRALTGEKG